MGEIGARVPAGIWGSDLSLYPERAVQVGHGLREARDLTGCSVRLSAPKLWSQAILGVGEREGITADLAVTGVANVA